MKLHCLFYLTVQSNDENSNQNDDVPPGRARLCTEEEFPGKRKKRADIENPPICWFIPDASITSGDDCEQTFNQTQSCEKSLIFLPLGVTTVCMKVETSSTEWVLSEGTNGYCGVSECCEWYPKANFCIPKRPLLNWYPKEAGTGCTVSGNKAVIGVEIIKGSANQTKEICITSGKPKDNGKVSFVTALAKLTNLCGGGCCIFDLMTKDN